MTYDLTGKRVLITGASSGIGAALARGMAERGAIVGICARRADRLRAVLDDCRRHRPESQMWEVDLGDLDRVTRFTLQAIDELGGLDVLVNNAGIPKRRTVAMLTSDEIDDVMRVNYLSPARMMITAVPLMLERARSTGSPAHVVNVASVAARLSPPGEAAYAASKAAITAFSECLAAETWFEPVQIHVVNPGVIDTELFDLPDNDEMIASEVERLPPSAVLDAVLTQIDTGTFETWVPEWFDDVAKLKANDVQGYLEGSATYWRDKQASPQS
jgi:NAD(P)-dependent dehydrogenase (short-subunit alcohol dehydrogenase family)